MTVGLYLLLVAGIPALLGFVLRRVAVIVVAWVALSIVSVAIDALTNSDGDMTTLGVSYVAIVYVALPAAAGASTGILARRLVERHASMRQANRATR